MKFLLLVVAVLTCAVTCLAQNATPAGEGKRDPTSQAGPKGKTLAEEEKRLDRPAMIFVKANRERIYATLIRQMRERKFELAKKDDDKIVFSQRVPGAHAALRRRSLNRTLTTPYIDDPRTTIAFIIIEKGGGFVVAGRMIATDIVAGQVFSFDASEVKQVRVALNKDLEKLKAEAEQEKH